MTILDICITLADFSKGAYRVLTDLGSFIAGCFALIAGVAAYRAGRLQADATKSAADEQVRATNEAASEQVFAVHNQMNEQRKAKDELDRRSGHALAKSLSMEAARVKMLVELRNKYLSQLLSQTGVSVISAEKANAFPLESMLPLRHNVELDALMSADTALAARVLLVSMDKLNAYVEFTSKNNTISGAELRELLEGIFEAGTILQRCASEEEARLQPRPIAQLDL